MNVSTVHRTKNSYMLTNFKYKISVFLYCSYPVHTDRSSELMSEEAELILRTVRIDPHFNIKIKLIYGLQNCQAQNNSLHVSTGYVNSVKIVQTNC